MLPWIGVSGWYQTSNDTLMPSNLHRSLKEIRSAIPSRLFVRDNKLGLMYTTRDLTMSAILWFGATCIDPTFQESHLRSALTPGGAEIMRWVAWAT
jgi:hypothetical protein